jgi:hypothetical protein
MKKLIPFLLVTSIMFPISVHGQPVGSGCTTPAVGNQGTTVGTTGTTIGNTGPAAKTSGSLGDPLKDVPNLACLFYKIVDFIMSFSYVVIAFFLLLAGFKFVTAQGSTEKLTDAKKTFMYTVIGALILIGANTIIAVVKTIITGLQGP